MKLIQKSSFNEKYLLTNDEGDKLKLKMYLLLKGYLLNYLTVFHKTLQGNQIYLGQYDWLT